MKSAKNLNQGNVQKSLPSTSTSSEGDGTQQTLSLPSTKKFDPSDLLERFLRLRRRRELSAAMIKEGGLNHLAVMYSCLFKIGYLVGAGNFNHEQLLKDFAFLSDSNADTPVQPLCNRCSGKDNDEDPSGTCNRCFHQGYFDAMQDIAAGNILPDVGSPNNEEYVQAMLLKTDKNDDNDASDTDLDTDLDPDLFTESLPEGTSK